jgi:hypothetical protein
MKNNLLGVHITSHYATKQKSLSSLKTEMISFSERGPQVIAFTCRVSEHLIYLKQVNEVRV